MENAFVKVLNLSLSAGLIVILVLLARLLLKKAPKWIHCLLWIIVGVRLVCPWNPVSPVGLLPDRDMVRVERVDLGSEADRTASVDRSDSAGYVQKEEITGYAYVPVVDTGITAIDNRINGSLQKTMAPGNGDSADPVQIYSFIAAVIWGIGFAGMLLYAVISGYSVKRRVREAVPYTGEAGTGNRYRILMTDATASPFILGIIRPVIYLPVSITPESAEYVLAHEKAHLSRCDHWWKPLGFLLLAVYWFNPFIWLAYVLLCRDIEMACDEKVISGMGNKFGVKYSETLLALSMPRRKISACPIAFGETGVKDRVKNVLNYKKPAFRIVCVSVAAVVIMGVIFLTNRKTAASGDDLPVENNTPATDNMPVSCRLLENASPATSALAIFYFDGEETKQKWIFDDEKKNEVIAEINGLNDRKEPQSRIADMTVPSYGIDICDKNGFSIWLTYSNGLWLTNDGAVYSAEYDFERLWSETSTEQTDAGKGGINMPNASILGEYDIRYYCKSEELVSEKDGVKLTFASAEEDIVNVTFTNDSDEDFSYGDFYYLQKEIDGEWYQLPVRYSNYGFKCILHVLQPGYSATEKCYLTMYGALKEGHYRIVLEDFAVEIIPDYSGLAAKAAVRPTGAHTETDTNTNTGAPDAVFQSDADYRDISKVRTYLAGLTSDPMEMEKSGVLLAGVSAAYSEPGRSKQIWNDFADRVNAGTPAVLTIASVDEIYDSERTVGIPGTDGIPGMAGIPGADFVTENPGYSIIFHYIYFDGENYMYYEDNRRFGGETIRETVPVTVPYFFTERVELPQFEDFEGFEGLEGMQLMLSDIPDINMKKFESMAMYNGYEEREKTVPFFNSFRAAEGLHEIRRFEDEKAEYGGILLSEAGFISGRYMTTSLLYMSPLSSSAGQCGTEIYSFDDDGYSVYPLTGGDGTPYRSAKRISEDWEDFYTEEEWNEKQKMWPVDNYGELFSHDTFKKISFDDGMEIYYGDGRLMLSRPGWMMYELKRIEE